jgi:23S rRNA (pseudouridine1915-N3)-methyltransferase
MKNGPERELVERYQTRFMQLASHIGMEFRPIMETRENRAKDVQTRKKEEAKALTPDALAQTRIIAFDEGGASLSSEKFAALLAQWRDEGVKNLILIIGGPDGLDESVRAKADRLLCFGAMTLPHQMVRVLVCEQLYRAATLLLNHPYHRQ